MRRLRRALIVLGIVAIAAYVGAMAWLVAHETTIVFAAGRPLGDLRPSAPFEQVSLPSGAPDEGQASPRLAWVMRAPAEPAAKPWVIFLHGNGANIASRLNIFHCEQLRSLGLNVMAPEYRGFGGTHGVPSEAGVDSDARAAYDYLVRQLHADPRRVIIYGWSLGSAVAVDLASHVDEAAVVLEGAPTSLAAIGARRYPYFPIRLLIHNPFESIRKIGKVGSPLLFLHSASDEIVPIEEGRRLFDAAPQPKEFVEVAGGHVYASERDPRFFPAIRSFLRAQRLLP